MTQEEQRSRLNALESRFSHVERMADELSAVVADQADRILWLTREVQRLRTQWADAGGAATPPDDKPPPHY